MILLSLIPFSSIGVYPCSSVVNCLLVSGHHRFSELPWFRRSSLVNRVRLSAIQSLLHHQSRFSPSVFIRVHPWLILFWFPDIPGFPSCRGFRRSSLVKHGRSSTLRLPLVAPFMSNHPVLAVAEQAHSRLWFFPVVRPGTATATPTSVVAFSAEIEFSEASRPLVGYSESNARSGLRCPTSVCSA
jgi:hypothetical protein